MYEVDLPGVNRDELQVEIRDHDLEITGEIKEREHAGVLRRHTRCTGRFFYRSTLASNVDASNVEAKLDNGVLSVRVPKAAAAKPQRIQIT